LHRVLPTPAIVARSAIVAALLVGASAAAPQPGNVGDLRESAPVLKGTSSPAPPSECTGGIQATPDAWRLTQLQYENTARDLLLLDELPELEPLPDSDGALQPDMAAAYERNGELLAEAFVADDEARDALPCQDDTEECVREIITDFGRLAFRRPLFQSEVDTFVESADLGGGFDATLLGILQTLLRSESFYTRPEIGGVPEVDAIALTDYEIASRLSYLLWDTMPDAELLVAADAGELSTKEQILAHAQRMLADGRARAMLVRFHESYVGMSGGSRWSVIEHDPAAFPRFRPELGPVMLEETRMLFGELTFQMRGTLQDLLLSPVAFVDADLAALYDFPDAEFGSELQRVELDPTSRPGVFTRLAFLASHAQYDRTSPILRGVRLLRDVLCFDVGAPPPQAAETPLPDDPSLVTNRQRVEAQTSDPLCRTCHGMIINPLGFALEGFDAVGASQSEEGGVAIDTTAIVVTDDSNTAEVSGPLELMTELAASPAVAECYARKWVEFAYRRRAALEDDCTIARLTANLIAGPFPTVELVASLTQTDSFRLRVGDPNVPSMPTPSGAGGSAAGGGNPGASASGGAPSTAGAQTSGDAGNDGSGATGQAVVGEDAGVPGASGDDATRGDSPQGLRGIGSSPGCGCRTAGSPASTSLWLGIGALCVPVLCALRRRRRSGPALAANGSRVQKMRSGARRFHRS